MTMWPQPDERYAAVPQDTRVYAIGDVHGRADLLARLHRMILTDAVDAPERRKVAVYLGDYVDRGPDSAGVIDLVLDDPLPGFEKVFLKGNHEDFMLRFLAEPRHGPLWMMNGGGATLASYGVGEGDVRRAGDRVLHLRDALRDRLPERHLDFLLRLDLVHQEGDYLFVHAGIRPGMALAAQAEEDLLWIREPFLSAEQYFGCVVVHGHTPAEVPEVRRNRINVDTGAVWTGTLTAVVLYGSERHFLHT